MIQHSTACFYTKTILQSRVYLGELHPGKFPWKVFDWSIHVRWQYLGKKRVLLINPIMLCSLSLVELFLLLTILCISPDPPPTHTHTHTLLSSGLHTQQWNSVDTLLKVLQTSSWPDKSLYMLQGAVICEWSQRELQLLFPYLKTNNSKPRL